MRKLFLFSFLILAFCFPFVVSAADGNYADEEGFLSKLEVNGNRFLFGSEVSLDEVAGDSAYVFGSEVEVKNSPQNDLYVVGSRVSVATPLNDDLFVAGGEVIIDNEVKGDIYVAAGKLLITSQGRIQGNLYSASPDTTIEGSVEGDVHARGTRLTLNGTIQGNVWSKFQQYQIAPGASIGGNLSYYGPDYFEGLSQVKGEVTQTGVFEKHSRWNKMFVWGVGIWDVISEFVMALVILLLCYPFTEKLAVKIRTKPFEHFGIGIVGVIALIVGCVVAALTVIGLSLAFIAGIFGFLVMLLTESFLYVSLLSFYKPAWKKKWGQRVLLLLLTVCIVKTFALLPYFGPLIVIILWVMIFGGLVSTVLKHLKKLRNEN